MSDGYMKWCGDGSNCVVPERDAEIARLRSEAENLRRERDEARESARIAADAHRKEGDRAIALAVRLREAEGLLREIAREEANTVMRESARAFLASGAQDGKEKAK